MGGDGSPHGSNMGLLFQLIPPNDLVDCWRHRVKIESLLAGVH